MLVCEVKVRHRKKTSEMMSMLDVGEAIRIGHKMRRDVMIGIGRVLDVEITGVVGKSRPLVVKKDN